ncbi:Prohead protease [uncultured Caudovirales phage]|uniref:Prohead protease n=1 Tax=uncultured Caudovirales phage TaxID=2100421 RepID=A0A6J5PBM1_9CAUD|nr:Prohead protease [uncultured Caudovirales phage]CAB4222880.1 Prohead protease [uncultured Caudovirales phage]
MIRLTATSVSIDAAASDGTPTRTITGIAVPYGVAATVSDGTEVIFERGSLPVDGKAPRLFLNHSSESAIGIVTARYDDEEGMMFTAKISKTALGDDALQLALDGVLDSVSVGVNPTKTRANKDGSLTVLAADWIELSMVPVPAFAGAIITDIAASIHHEDEEISIIETEPTQENEPMSEVTVPTIEASIPTASIPAQPRREFAMPSAAEVLAAYHIGGETYNKVSDAFKQAQRKNQTALQAAAGDIVTGDTPGLLNIPVLGPLFQDLNFVRPVVSAFGARAMPSTTSRQFVRPTITTHTSAAVQSNQLDAVSATTMVIAANTVTKSTVAGQVTLSIQDIDFTDPSALQLVLNDLAGEVLIKTDDIAADALVAGKTASGSTWTVTANDPSSLISSLYDAAREITEDSNFFPTHLCVSPDVWEKLGSQLDGSKRPVLGYTTNGVLGQNALGRVGGLGYNMMDVMGLSLVVDNNFASGTMLVVYAPGFEIYESGASLQSFENPSTLGRTLSIHQYFATFVAKSSFIQAITIA